MMVNRKMQSEMKTNSKGMCMEWDMFSGHIFGLTAVVLAVVCVLYQGIRWCQ